MPKRSSTDLNEIAYRIVGAASGESRRKRKNPAAVALGRLGGKVGGKARAAKLSAEERRAIATKAAKKRWQTSTRSDEDGR
jgi:hypothetical protein